MKQFLLISWVLIQISLKAQYLTGVDSWAYQLQNINTTEISNSTSFNLVVIDYSSDGTEQGKFTRQEIAQIKQSGKIVLSYISIGEAENYRYYWNDSWDADGNGEPDAGAPSWLGSENSNWQGNYKVRYWEPEWQNIILGYVDKIMQQGFDGIYCDIIDAYYYWAEETGEKPEADTLMMDFIFSLREHVRQNSDEWFYIVPQNGEYIIEENNVDDYRKTHYFNSIDAIAVEDVFCFGDAEENNPFNPDYDRVEVLNKYQEWGIPVLSVEYLTTPELINQYLNAAGLNNFIPYVTVRALDVFTDIPTTLDNCLIPEEYFLYQNYPNPFNPSTVILFNLAESEVVTLDIYDITGRKIKTLLHERMKPGRHYVDFDSENLPSGIYFYRLITKNYKSARKMILIK